MRYLISVLAIALAIGVVFPHEAEARGKRKIVVIQTQDGPVRLWKGNVYKSDDHRGWVEVVNPNPIRNICREGNPLYEFEESCFVKERKLRLIGFDGKGENIRFLFRVVSRPTDKCHRCGKGVLFFWDLDSVKTYLEDAIEKLIIKKKKRRIRRILQP